MDLIGPWIVQVHGNPYEFSVLTAIDTVTNLVELIIVDNKTSETIARKYARCWLSGFPWPQMLGLYNILDRYSRYLRTSMYVQRPDPS